MRRLAVLTMLLAGCAGAGSTRPPPDPPVLAGSHPAIGREFGVELTGEDGGEAKVAPAPGRVLVACLAGPDADVIAGPCPGVLEKWRDRVTVIGIVAGGTPAPEQVRATAFRLFADPERRTAEKYRLEDRPQVLITDARGRIAAVVPEGELGRVDPLVEGLLFGTDSWKDRPSPAP